MAIAYSFVVVVVVVAVEDGEAMAQKEERRAEVFGRDRLRLFRRSQSVSLALRARRSSGSLCQPS